MNYCPKCGKPLTEGATFCMNCGAKVETTPIGPAQAVASAPKKKTFPLPALIFAILVILVIGIVKVFPAVQIHLISGLYEHQLTLEDYDATTIQLNDDKTASYSLLGTITMDGSWTYKDGQVILTTTFLGSTSEETYILYKNYLVPVDYIYQGNIPSGNHFDATLSETGSSNKYVFSSDGTVIKYTDDGKTYNYTYTRDENWITTTSSTGNDSKFLILKDGICNDYFTKQ